MVKLTEAQKAALQWLPAVEGRVRYNFGEISGSALAALERKGLAQSRWTAFPKIEHPWSITAEGIKVRAALADGGRDAG